MISLKSVAHRYDQQQDIRFEDWQIDAGSQWLLLGASGSGKSTLLHILTGILKPTQGSVSIKGTSIYDLSSKELDQFRGRNIGIVFQRPHLIKSLSISENLVIAQSFAKLPTDLKRVNEVLDALGISHKKNAYPDQLSQGQLQRVSIARAVINKPALLIADEPTSSLDDNNAAVVLDLLMQQSGANQATLLVATHDKRVKDAFKHTYELS
ncbi:ABC transporter ATP-binding protein [Pedobacter gandavensis]|uniref:ATP-binding cassette domain-containing protein n=1 Tax=Pedobacter gandavensis TaxID=2679963 RepID=A0ABR6F117_9SPHI|nr:ATP-binding cassette domain-containing protein [Pedobacter gandavensis]MBB2150719.1 ATP-binding cassette domain-containing protein [Pedobacter gandavensis]